MLRPEVIAAALVGIGVACLAGAWAVRQQQTASFAERPAASGEVGIVLVYAQTERGPSRLQPGRVRALARPQPLAFQLTADGTGPRIARIELEAAGRRTVMHEERIEAPATEVMIDYVLELDERLPDDLVLHVVVEAPHAMSYQSSFPLKLTGSSKDPFPGLTGHPAE
ncbi:hypothetical protein L6R52_29595 [Myxococcota bacterium]|nr:hypothetical protein [Myxococcota bacterium]